MNDARSTDYLEPSQLLGDAIAMWHILSELGDGDPYAGTTEFRRITRVNFEDGKADVQSFLSSLAQFLPDAAQYLKKYCPESLYSRGDLADTMLAIGRGIVVPSTQSVGSMVNLYMRAFWYESGMPVIQVGHKLAASLILTNVPDPVLQAVKFPFKCFRIDVPTQMLSIEGLSGIEHITSVLIGGYPLLREKEGIGVENDATCYVAYTDGSSNLWNVQRDAFHLLRAEISPELEPECGPLDYSLTKQDERTTVLLKRLIANVLIYLTEGGKTKAVGKGHNEWKGNRRESKRPTRRVFQLTQKVKHDFREVVTNYSNGTGHKLSVQSIVIGHWKQQPCGLKGQDRKRIFVEPYWRGPEDAPIASRPHMVR